MMLNDDTNRPHRKRVRHIDEPGHVHELTFSCYRRRPLLVEDAVRMLFCEAHWSLIGLWTMLLYAEQHLHRRGIPPRRLGVAAVLRAFRGMLTTSCGTLAPSTRFANTLDAAVVDSYVRRRKNSRNDPRKKYDLPCGPPAITNATHQQQQNAQQLRRNGQTGLTA